MQRIPRWAVALCAALLIGLFLGRLLDTAARKSLTVDEPHYIGRGLHLWETGSYHFEKDLSLHPPLAYHLASAALLFLPIDVDADSPRVGLELLEQETPDPALIRFASRLPFALLACWGALLCFLWAREAGGEVAGLLALVLYTFSPTLLAHGGLVHSDISVTVFYLQTLYAYWRWTRSPSPARLVGCGLSLGLALLAKLSALLLLPTLGLLLAIGLLRPTGVEAERRIGARAVRGLGVYASLLALAVGVVWLGYGASLALATDAKGPLPDTPLPGYLRSFLWDVLQNAAGRPVYFLGEISRAAPWSYLPVAFALKVPVGTLLLLAIASLTLIQQRPGLGACVGVAAGVYGLAFLVLAAPLGIRYALPLFPLLFVFAGVQLSSRAPLWRRGLIAVGLVWMALASLRIHPHYLAYFNEIAGGPEEGGRYLIESNLDWGQDLGTLARWLEGRENGPLRLAYFGPEPPERYGIRSQPLRGCRETAGTIAVSVNILFELYHPKAAFRRPRAGCYDWLRQREPVARPGYSIYVYEIPPPSAPQAPPGRS